MQKLFNRWLWSVGIISLFLFVQVIPAHASSISAPTVLKTNSFKSYSLMAPVISGVTPKDTNVLVFIDDVFAGNAKIQNSDSVSDSFYFQAFGLSAGSHTAYLVSENPETLERSAQSATFSLSISGLPAPTLLVPNEDTITGMVKPLIEGFAISGSFVRVFIDGVYNGMTEVVEHESGTAHFSYLPFLNLAVGQHKMWAVSEDQGGRQSKVSEVVEFNIEERMPAPTMFGPITKRASEYKQPTIVGLAKNNSRIKVYIDKKLDGQFEVENHESGTANFAYKPSVELTDGKHFVFTTALDERGKESIWSNIVYFKVGQSEIVATINETGVEEQGKIGVGSAESSSQNGNEDKLARLKDLMVYARLFQNDKTLRLNNSQYQDLAGVIDAQAELEIEASDLALLQGLLNTKETAEETGDTSNSENVDIKDILDKDLATGTDELGGAIDESKNQQGKLGWNAIIFVLFLLAVIAWIFWVNRELIKEKQEQEEKEKEAQEEK